MLLRELVAAAATEDGSGCDNVAEEAVVKELPCVLSEALRVVGYCMRELVL